MIRHHTGRRLASALYFVVYYENTESSEGNTMHEQFLRTQMLLGTEALEKLQKARVAVFGIGYAKR